MGSTVLPAGQQSLISGERKPQGCIRVARAPPLLPSLTHCTPQPLRLYQALLTFSCLEQGLVVALLALALLAAPEERIVGRIHARYLPAVVVLAGLLGQGGPLGDTRGGGGIAILCEPVG